MILQLLKLKWKSLVRSSDFEKSLLMKFFLVLLGIYFAGCYFFVGFSLVSFFKKDKADAETIFGLLNQLLIYWIFLEVIIRFFFQKIPSFNVKPFLTQAISKNKLTHYILGSSIYSYFNLLPLFLFLPACIYTLSNSDFTIQVLGWLCTILSVIVCLHFLNFFINRNYKIFFILFCLFGSLGVLNYLEYISLKNISKLIFDTIFHQPYLCVIPISFTIFVYYLFFKNIKNSLYLDGFLKKKTKSVKIKNYGWLNNFGEIAPLLELDFKLIKRNKRPRNQTLICILFLGYGLLVNINPYFGNSKIVFGFISTSFFVLNFGQFIPAWDSEYYSMLMTQNLSIRKYINAKVTLMTISVVLSFILCIPYLYFGWELLVMIFCFALYNAGINIPIILLFSSMNCKRLDLDKSVKYNIQGVGVAQLLLGLPVIGLPTIIYFVAKIFTNSAIEIYVVIAGVGVIGLLFRYYFINVITKLFIKAKYNMISGFSEKNY